MRTRAGAGAALLAALILGVAGCGGTGDTTSNTAPESGGRSASPAAGHGSASSDPTGGPGEGGSASEAPTALGKGQAKGGKAQHAGSSSGSATADPSTADPAADESAQPTRTGKQTAVLSRVPGTASKTCVAVRSARDIRSDAFMAGPFDAARNSYGHRQPGVGKRNVRLYFVPLHARTMPGLTLRFHNAATGASVTTRQTQTADAEQWRFYDTQTVLPTGGTWQVRATAGADSGCFVFTLPAA